MDVKRFFFTWSFFEIVAFFLYAIILHSHLENDFLFLVAISTNLLFPLSSFLIGIDEKKYRALGMCSGILKILTFIPFFIYAFIEFFEYISIPDKSIYNFSMFLFISGFVVIMDVLGAIFFLWIGTSSNIHNNENPLPFTTISPKDLV